LRGMRKAIRVPLTPGGLRDGQPTPPAPRFARPSRESPTQAAFRWSLTLP
jgi:hypothetical protein